MITHIDCTLRDGGYYNNWDFAPELIADYLAAMRAAEVDYVELGLRSFERHGFRGACAYTTDDFIRSLSIPEGLKVGVMVNAAELLRHPAGIAEACGLLFTSARDSPVRLVRIACHVHEFEAALPACIWLKEAGYSVGINLMQVADRSAEEIERISALATSAPIDTLYFADSLGSMDPARTAEVVALVGRHWTGAIGIHTHDNMGRAMANTLRAIEAGVTWVDSTVTGMGRGPGNAQTEYMLIELDRLRGRASNVAPLLALIRQYFGPMRHRHGWGANPYYYLAGMHGIHPTYVQEMLSDSRYEEAEILSVLDHLRRSGAKQFRAESLVAGRQALAGSDAGSWAPSERLRGRKVLVVASGPGAQRHRTAIERYVRREHPFVIALNTQQHIDESLIDARAACHPFRLIADAHRYPDMPQPLIVPAAQLPEVARRALAGVQLLDFGLGITPEGFAFGERSARAPAPLVVAYALAVATSGQAAEVLLAGFDGFPPDDPRGAEMEEIIALYQEAPGALPITAITPTRYSVPETSVYAL